MTEQQRNLNVSLHAARPRFATWGRLKLADNKVMRLVLLLLVAALFARTLCFSFVMWDDDIHLAANRLMHPPTLDALWGFFQKPFFGLYIPITYAFWWVIAWFSHLLQSGWFFLPAWPFHLANLLLHALNVLCVHQLLWRLFRHKSAAFCGALLFAWHPLQVEAVAWVSGAKDLLCTLFSLLALLTVLTSKPSSWGRTLLVSSLLCLLALLAKPTAVALPGMLIGVLWLDRHTQKLPATRPLWSSGLIVGSWTLLALPMIALTHHLQSAEVAGLSHLSLFQRGFVAADALMFYLGKLLVPYPLLVDYGRTPAIALAGVLPYALILPGCLLALACRLWPRAMPPLLCALSVALFAMLPQCGLLPFAFQRVSTVADRYVYLPMVGVALVVGFLVSRLLRVKWWWMLAALLLVTTWGLRTFQQCAAFRDSTSLFIHVLAFNPQSFSAHNNLGILALQQGDIDGAMAHLTSAARLDPHSYKTIDNLGVAWQRLGRYTEAVEFHQRAMLMEPHYATAYVNLAEAYRHLGQSEQAKDAYESALQVTPTDYLAHNNYGVFLEDQGQYAAAEAHYRAATALWVAPFLPYYNLGLLYEKQGRRAEAAVAYATALKIRPEAKAVQDGLGRVRAPFPAQP